MSRKRVALLTHVFSKDSAKASRAGLHPEYTDATASESLITTSAGGIRDIKSVGQASALSITPPIGWKPVELPGHSLSVLGDLTTEVISRIVSVPHGRSLQRRQPVSRDPE